MNADYGVRDSDERNDKSVPVCFARLLLFHTPIDPSVERYAMPSIFLMSGLSLEATSNFNSYPRLSALIRGQSSSALASRASSLRLLD